MYGIEIFTNMVSFQNRLNTVFYLPDEGETPKL